MSKFVIRTVKNVKLKHFIFVVMAAGLLYYTLTRGPSERESTIDKERVFKPMIPARIVAPKPIKSFEPVISLEPREPAKSLPVDPVASVNPVERMKSVKSETAINPLGRVMSVEPFEPVKPKKEVTSVTRVEPVKLPIPVVSPGKLKLVVPLEKIKPVGSHAREKQIKTKADDTITSNYWEELTSNDPALTNWTSCADSQSSVMVLKDKQEFYRTGDVVTVNIAVKDFLGRRKRAGGDFVRVLVKDSKNNAYSIGSVTDRLDGTYTAVVKLLWAGNITIEAAVSTPRELVRLMYHNVRIGKQRRPILGKFTRGKNITTVECTPVEEIASHYKKSCNLTHMNAGLPWFCVKPSNFTCSQWRNSYNSREIDLTDEELQMIQRVANSLKMNTTIRLKVIEDNPDILHFTHKYKLIPCNKLSTRDTWNTTSPVGYMYNGTWYSTQCRSTFDGSKESYEKCLSGKRVWLLGDSNMREITTHLIKFLNLTLVTEKWTKLKWHKDSLASNKNGTISVFWGLHALPRYGSESWINGTHQYIDAIPSGSEDIVVVHFYMHYQPFYPSAVRDHIRKTVQSVQALKVRAPQVKVVVRGSHAFFMAKEISHFNDFWGFVYNKILIEEFASLLEDVIFLDGWDITAAAENKSMHPTQAVLKQMVNYMIALICP